MTADDWFHAGTLLSIGVSLLIAIRFLAALGRGFVTGLIRGYRQQRPSRGVADEPPAAPPTDLDALLDRVDTAVRALRTSAVLLTTTTDALAAVLTAAAEPPTTDDPPAPAPPARPAPPADAEPPADPRPAANP